MLERSDSAPTCSKQAKPKRKAHRLSDTRSFLLQRMAELRRLSVFRMRYAAAIGDVDAWAFLTAEICLYHPDCNYDMITFRKVDPLDINAEVAAAALDRVERIDRNARRRGGMYRPTSGVVAGRILNLTAEECWQCDIRTMCPVDPMPA